MISSPPADTLLQILCCPFLISLCLLLPLPTNTLALHSLASSQMFSFSFLLPSWLLMFSPAFCFPLLFSHFPVPWAVRDDCFPEDASPLCIRMEDWVQTHSLWRIYAWQPRTKYHCEDQLWNFPQLFMNKTLPVAGVQDSFLTHSFLICASLYGTAHVSFDLFFCNPCSTEILTATEVFKPIF